MPNNFANSPAPVAAADVGQMLAALPPFLPPPLVSLLAEYDRKYSTFSKQIARFGEPEARAAFGRRLEAARRDPSPDNLAVLDECSQDELIRRYLQKQEVHINLRNDVIRRFAAEISRQLKPILFEVVRGFRKQCDDDFKDVCTRWGVSYDSGQNEAIRRIDTWLWHAEQVLDAEEHARRTRYPAGWESLLPSPDRIASLVGGNLTPRAEQPAPPPTASPAPAPLQTAAEIAAKAT